MAEGLTLRIISPEGILPETAVTSVRMNTPDGWFGVRRGASPVAALLTAGEIRYDTESGEHSFNISGGFADVKENTVTIITDEPA